jgi:hypothetical protein
MHENSLKHLSQHFMFMQWGQKETIIFAQGVVMVVII